MNVLFTNDVLQNFENKKQGGGQGGLSHVLHVY